MSEFVLADGSVICPVCHVTRYNMPLMLKHLYFWHDLAPPDASKVVKVIEEGADVHLVIREAHGRRRLYVDVPLPGF